MHARQPPTVLVDDALRAALARMTACGSCGYPMNERGDHAPGDPHSAHCAYCSKPDGTLQDFDERFERMVQWSLRRDGLDRAAAEQRTRASMRTMPLWKDHLALAGA